MLETQRNQSIIEKTYSKFNVNHSPQSMRKIVIPIKNEKNSDYYN